MSYSSNFTQVNYENKFDPENPVREYTGLWIPVQIEDSDILPLEKLLWAKIHALDGAHGCYASNSFFAKQLKVSERTVQRMLLALKNRHLIFEEKFDGRHRILRCSIKKSINDKFDTSATTKPTINDKFDTSATTSVSPINNSIYNKERSISKDIDTKKGGKPPKPPVCEKEKKEVVGKDGVVKLTKTEIEKLRKIMPQAELEHWIKEIEDYIAIHGKKGYKDYYRVILKWKAKEDSRIKKMSSIGKNSPKSYPKGEKYNQPSFSGYKTRKKEE